MEQDRHSSEHLSLERISALLDDPGEDPEAARHLESCPRCDREHERMRRMRMALSALGGVAPPEDEWEEIEPRLPDRDAMEAFGGNGDDDVIPIFRSTSVARLAVATLVFAVGLGAGLQLRDGAPTAAQTAAEGSPEAAVRGAESAGTVGNADVPTGDAGAARFTAGGDGADSYASAARGLESLVGGRADSAVEPLDEPVAAAEEMARLEALAEAAREALREHPADPALNNFLFRVNERQESLRSRLGAAARLASLDFR